MKLNWRLLQAGYCRHPECSVRTDGSLRPTNFPALCALIQHPTQGFVLFDTGYSEQFMQVTRRLPNRLYRAVTPVHFDRSDSAYAQIARLHIDDSALGTIVFSHLHADHIGGAGDFPHAQIICSKSAVDDLQTRSKLSALRNGLLSELLPVAITQRMRWVEQQQPSAVPAEFFEFGDAYDLFEDGSMLLVDLPGHAVCQVGLIFRDKSGAWVFLVADAAWRFQSVVDGVLPPTIMTWLLGDPAQYKNTMEKLNRLAKRYPEVKIVPSHCPQWADRVGLENPCLEY